MTDDLVGRLRALLVSRAVINGMARGPMGYASRAELDAVTQLRSEAVDALSTLLARIKALEAENRKLREAIKPFADCADELDGSEWTPRAPDGEWAKFRLLTDDYRAARAALTPEPPHAD